MQINQLNQDHSIASRLIFKQGAEEKSAFPFIYISNQYADAVISIYGGQVLSFQPKDQANDVLFVSDNAYYQPGKAIKGGIPICWPWFGDDPENKGRAAHGFVRNRQWSVKQTATTAAGETQVVLGLVDTPETRSIWPFAFQLTLTITVGKTLHLKLLTQNTGDKPFLITQALHSYFFVGDIHQTRVTGLQNKEYIDKTVSPSAGITQHGDIIVDKEVDRIYINTPAETQLNDAALKRIVVVKSAGSHSTVVWNPWIKGSAQMADLQDDDYLHFLCVETTNAATDVVNVASGTDHCLTAEISVG